jgi:tetrahydromethanopterin S-methyltransferase subunit D
LYKQSDECNPVDTGHICSAHEVKARLKWSNKKKYAPLHIFIITFHYITSSETSANEGNTLEGMSNPKINRKS